MPLFCARCVALLSWGIRLWGESTVKKNSCHGRSIRWTVFFFIVTKREKISRDI